VATPVTVEFLGRRRLQSTTTTTATTTTTTPKLFMVMNPSPSLLCEALATDYTRPWKSIEISPTSSRSEWALPPDMTIQGPGAAFFFCPHDRIRLSGYLHDDGPSSSTDDEEEEV